MNFNQDTKKFKKMTDEYDKVKYQCKNCGRKMVIPQWVDKQLCDWCGNYVFKTKKDEDLYRIKEKLKGAK